MLNYTFLSVLLFFIGLFGFFGTRTNIITLLMALELALLAINLNFITFSSLFDDAVGQVFAFLVLTVAAAESAIGLAILVIYYRLRGFIAIDLVSSLKG
jgi:NADH-quinone oxidoreductase subunit K